MQTLSLLTTVDQRFGIGDWNGWVVYGGSSLTVYWTTAPMSSVSARANYHPFCSYKSQGIADMAVMPEGIDLGRPFWFKVTRVGLACG